MLRGTETTVSPKPSPNESNIKCHLASPRLGSSPPLKKRKTSDDQENYKLTITSLVKSSSVDLPSSAPPPNNFPNLRPEFQFPFLIDHIPPDFSIPLVPAPPNISPAPVASVTQRIGILYDHIGHRRIGRKTSHRGYAQLRIPVKEQSNPQKVSKFIDDRNGNRHKASDVLFCDPFRNNHYNGVRYDTVEDQLQAMANDMYKSFAQWLDQRRGEKEAYFQYVRDIRRFERDLLVQAVVHADYPLPRHSQLRAIVTPDIKVRDVCVRNITIESRVEDVIGAKTAREWEGEILASVWWSDD